MVGNEGVGPLDPVETLRSMIALRDNNPNPLAKRLYALANPRYNTGKVLRYIATKEAFTLDLLAYELKIPKPSLYDVIHELESWCVVYKGYTIDMGVPGAKPIMYVLAKADPSRVADAHKLHLELRGTSIGGVMESPLRQLVAPIVDEMMAFIMKMQDESRWQVPLWEVKDRFREAYGYVPADFDYVVNRLVKEKGWGLSIKGV